MTSSLHVSLPDEMRAYVDLRTNGEKTYATPSEYIRALIRNDMEMEQERLYVFRELLQGIEDVERSDFLPLSVLDDIENDVLANDR